MTDEATDSELSALIVELLEEILDAPFPEPVPDGSHRCSTGGVCCLDDALQGVQHELVIALELPVMPSNLREWLERTLDEASLMCLAVKRLRGPLERGEVSLDEPIITEKLLVEGKR